MKSAGELIDPRLLEWARQAGIREFTSVQLEAFVAILCESTDLIVGGPTSSGKTEAVFLPLLTMAAKRKGGTSILMISPTRALINDQYRRLIEMAQRVGLPVCKWHGNASTSGKNTFTRAPHGLIIMTPESLEGRFLRNPLSIERFFGSLDAVVIDENHDFLSGPRGHQLASLLARLDRYGEAPFRKIGISATLGDVDHAKRWLSPSNHRSVRLIDGDSTSIPLLARIRGYEAPASKNVRTGKRRLIQLQRAALPAIAEVLVQIHRRGSHLVFAGSKKSAEQLRSYCADLAAAEGLPDRFRVHHASMDKGFREEVEEELREGLGQSVVTTSTLELGIDIGAIDSIDQIGAPQSLTSFRQRIGRSGRRGQPAIVRIHVTEEALEYSVNLLDRLRLNTARALAALNLLKRRFVEPGEADGTIWTVILQQTLSYIHENGGATYLELERLIRSATPFFRVSPQSYAALLAELCKPGLGLLYQSDEGKYLLDIQAEKLLESEEIYAAFEAFDYWDICTRRIDVGVMPRSMSMKIGDTRTLCGRSWKVIAVDERRSRVTVEPATSGYVPYFNMSGQEEVHPELAAEMLRVLRDGVIPTGVFDPIAEEFLQQGQATFRDAQLSQRVQIEDVEQEMCHLFTWKGTKFNSLLATLLRFKRFACDINEVAVSVSCVNAADVAEALSGELPTIEELSNFVECVNVGKFDKWIPEKLLREDWAKRHEELFDDLLAFCAAVRR
ncbi:MAG TPA: DEAD/DEAH box helicase [Sphingomicrobium sp.]|nr:DEAD/DEAH box helicase [Sphingomicrobium sp.]